MCMCTELHCYSTRKYHTRALKLLEGLLTSTLYSNCSNSEVVSIHVLMSECSVKPCFCLRAHAVCLYLAFDATHSDLRLAAFHKLSINYQNKF